MRGAARSGGDRTRVSSRWGLLLAAALVAAALTSAGKPAPQPRPAGTDAVGQEAAISDLAERLDAILADPRYDGSQAGLVVRSATSGETLYSRHADERLLPASNTKLFTSVAALDLLGPQYRWRTSVRSPGHRTGGTLHGNLYLRGGGDPTLLASDYDALAARIRASGITTVTGTLYADDTFFDRTRLGTNWAWDDEPFYYDAQISGLTAAPNTDYDSGTVIVESRPGTAAGSAARLTLVPRTGYVTVVNHATTGAAGTDNTISVEREHGTNRIVVTGSIPLDADAGQDWSTVWEPTGYAADLFRRALARHGVKVSGPTKLGSTPSGARELAGHNSMTLADLLIPFLKLSNNMHAETLVKTIGHKDSGTGSWDAGLAAIADRLGDLGVDTDTLRMADGSGLSRWDMIPPEQILNLLVGARYRPWFETWYDALPIAGAPDRLVGGTLRSRMRDTPAANNLHGKTGSLTGVSGLSGYVTDADGELLVFSFLSNNYLASSVKDVEDAVGVTLASFSRDAATLARTAPVRPARPAHPARADVECSWLKAC